MILALCDQKGGVGKSTTAFHLARAAVTSGQRVLLVDLDPQASLTSAATSEGALSEEQAGIADVLSSRTDETIHDVMVPGVWPGMDVVPVTSYETLGSVRDELIATSQSGRESRLREALSEVSSDYDLILIDCAPTLDQLTINGLTAADGVVVVSHTRRWSLNGMASLLRTIGQVQDYYNPLLRVAGVVVDQHEEHTVAGRHWGEQLDQAAAERGLSVLAPRIPKRAVIADATEASLGLDEWGGRDAAELAAIYTRHLATLKGATR